jgi:RNA polymerase sigma-70 factor (ECF subfamily)
MPSGRRGDSAAAFAAVYDEHIWRVYAFFAYRVGSRADAEDLTQATFERALRAWQRFDPRRASAATWLLTIARNLLIDHLRRDASRLSLSIDADQVLEDRLPVSPDPNQRLGLDPALETALSRLGDRERDIVALRFGWDLSGPEIAELLDLSLANVQQILSRTLRRLRAELEGQSVSSSSPP